MNLVGQLLNSEGPLLSLHTNENGEHLLKIYSHKYNGDLIVRTSFKKVVSYIESKLTLNELIQTSTEYHFKSRNVSEVDEPSLDEIKSSIVEVDKYFNEFPDSMK